MRKIFVSQSIILASFLTVSLEGRAVKMNTYHRQEYRKVNEAKPDSEKEEWLKSVFKKKNKSAPNDYRQEVSSKRTEEKHEEKREEKPKQSFRRAGGSLGRSAFMSSVKRYEGSPYVWGAEGPRSFDCTGLITYVLDNKGCLDSLGVGRLTSGNIPSYLSSKSMSACKVGDILRVGGHAAFFVGPDNNDVYGAVGKGGGSQVTDHHLSGTCYQNPCFGS
jgi:hypothetical protein